MAHWRFGPMYAGLVLAGSAWSSPDTYTLDTVHSAPVFNFSHLGLTTQSGRFDRASGTAVLDFEARRGRVSYEVDAASLNMGFGTEKPDSPGYRLFQAMSFPKIRFDSDHLVFDDHGHVIAAEGRLTLLGVTKPVKVQVDSFQCSISRLNGKRICAGDVSAVFKRSAFGMVDYLPEISDEITLHIPIEAYRN